MPKAKSDNIKAFVAFLNANGEKYGLNTKMCVAHFLGQVAYESQELETFGKAESFPELQALMCLWLENDLSTIADNDDARSITLCMNGEVDHLAQRLYYTRMAKRVLGV